MDSENQEFVHSLIGEFKHRALSPEEEAQRAEAEAQRVKTTLARHTAELRTKWCAPKRHTQATNLVPTGQWGVVNKRLRDALGKGFLFTLIGGRGSGKTQLAVELMREATRQQYATLYTTASEFFMSIKATYRKDSKENEGDVLARYRKPHVLIMDEFGRTSETEWEGNLMFELINKRYTDMHDTVLISNHNKEDLLASLGPSLASRMQETGGIIECNWPSWREKAE